MTAGELIAILQELPPETELDLSGDYGYGATLQAETGQFPDWLTIMEVRGQ